MQIQNLCHLEGEKLNWSGYSDWKISDKAWEILKANKVDPMIVFANPKVLQLNPSFLKYYRSIAMLPQKGLKAISGVSSVERIESGKVNAGTLSNDVVNKLVASVNEILSLVISLVTNIGENEIKGMMYATAGTNIDGSWRNSIGNEGERVIRTIILRELLTQKDISSICDRQNRTSAISDLDEHKILESLENIRTINLKNGFSILFTSEPDITLYDDSGNIVGAIR